MDGSGNIRTVVILVPGFLGVGVARSQGLADYKYERRQAAAPDERTRTLNKQASHSTGWGSTIADRATWLALWRPYRLAKRRFPEWLPLASALTPFQKL